MKIKVAVIFGGNSVEHDISIISALQAIKNFNKSRYEVVPIYITKDLKWLSGKNLLDIKNYRDMNELYKKASKVDIIKKGAKFYVAKQGIFNRGKVKIDVAFPIVHGKNIEDGTIQGYLELLGIPYVGSNVTSSSLSQDKVLFKQIMKSNDIPVVDAVWFYDNDYFEKSVEILKQIKKLGYPVVVKPAALGSSIGIHVVSNEEHIEDAIMDVMQYDNKIVVEAKVPNLIEVNCSVFGNYEHAKASVLEEVVSREAFLTYQEKYIGKSGKLKGMQSARRIIPANISSDTANLITDMALKTFKILNLSGVVRIDFLINQATNEVYINEVNSIPGSLSYYLWEKSKKKYPYLLDDLITLAMKDDKIKKSKISSFQSNILSQYNPQKGSISKLKF